VSVRPAFCLLEMMTRRFRDRQQAGQALGQELRAYARRRDVIVFGLPRGGVPVAFEVAQALRAPLDVCLVRKLGVPGREELAMGAVAPGGIRILNWELVESLGLSKGEIDTTLRREEGELARSAQLYRGNAPRLTTEERITILVDDGLATGATMRAAVVSLQEQQAARVVVAVPVAARSACDELAGEADELVCLETPEPFYAVGLWFQDFRQTTDDEVRDLLALAARPRVEAQPVQPGS